MPAVPPQIIARLEEAGWLIEAAFAAALTIVVFVLWKKAERRLRQASAGSDTPWDNIFLSALGAPVSLLIALLGGLHIADSLSFLLAEVYRGIDDTLATWREVLILAFIFWILLRLVNRVETHYRHRQLKVGEKELHHGTLHAIFQSLRALIIVIIALSLMEAAGVSISGLLAFGGIGGIILGFAAKDTLANFFSGLLIFWERPFVVGDWIRHPTANIEGTVEDIGWRMTQVRTFDHRPLYVPNSLFFNSVIENPQRMTNRRIYEYIGVRYQDIDKMPAILADIRQMLETDEAIDQDKIIMVNFDRYGASSLDFFIYAMTKTTQWREYHFVKEKVMLGVAAIVRRHGADFAFPTRTVHHVSAADAPPPPV